MFASADHAWSVLRVVWIVRNRVCYFAARRLDVVSVVVSSDKFHLTLFALLNKSTRCDHLSTMRDANKLIFTIIPIVFMTSVMFSFIVNININSVFII